MPINSTIDPDNRLVLTVCTGVISMNDFHYYLYEFLAKNEIKGCNEIFDTTAADWSNISYSDLMTVSQKAGEIAAIDNGTKFAWVVGGPEVKELTEFYKTTKLLQTKKSRILRAFDGFDEAMHWIMN